MAGVSTTPRVRRAESLESELQVPVVIVGAGACGLVAAIALRDAGVDCVLLERDSAPGGSSALSAGFIPACGTAAQRAAGVSDSEALFSADIEHKARGRAAPHLVRAYVRAVGPALDRLQQQHGLPLEVLDGFLYPGHCVRRMHAVPQRTGATLLTQALVRELICNTRDEVIGVSYERPDGSMETLACELLLLACNGFGGNPAMVQELLPEMRDASFAGHVGNDGSAVAWGRALQARLADLGGYQGHGAWAVPQGALISWALMMEGGVQINARGQRFHDETQGYSEASVHVLAQPGSVAWAVFDDPVLALARSFPDFCAAEAAGALKTCADAQALATLIGCDLATLQATLDGMAPLQTDAFGRTFQRALRAPFHAVKVTGALFHTQGGLDIDEHCRVLRHDGQPFPNLLAAGGAARGVSGDAVWGYLSGNGLLSAVAGGAIAAATAARQLQ